MGIGFITFLPLWGFPGVAEVKNLPANTGDVGSDPGSGRSPGEGNGNPLQDSCRESPMDRGAWRATCPWGRRESDVKATNTLMLPAAARMDLGIIILSEVRLKRTNAITYIQNLKNKLIQQKQTYRAQ